MKKSYNVALASYCEKQLTPWISRFAYNYVDKNTDKLKSYLKPFWVKKEVEIEEKNIEINEILVKCLASSTLKKNLRKLQGKDKALEFAPGRYVEKVQDHSLQRICDGFLETTEGEIIEIANNVKINFVKNLMENNNKDKFLILTAYRESMKLIQRRLDCYIYDSLDKDRDTEFDKFIKSTTSCALVSTVATLSTGFNLDCADHLIFYSLCNNTNDIIQAKGRINRRTSTRDKYYYYLFLDVATEENKIKTKLDKIKDLEKSFGFYKEKEIKHLTF